MITTIIATMKRFWIDSSGHEWGFDLSCRLETAHTI